MKPGTDNLDGYSGDGPTYNSYRNQTIPGGHRILPAILLRDYTRIAQPSK